MGNDSKGRRGRGGGVVGKDVNSIINPLFLVYCSLLGFFFFTKNIEENKKRNGQVLNKLQMRLLLKNPGGTLLQIQTVYIYSFTHRRNKGER